MPKGQKKTDVLSRTERWELRVTSEQEKLLVAISTAQIQVYNWAFDWRIKAYQLQKSLSVGQAKTSFADCLKQVGKDEWGLEMPDEIKRHLYIQINGLSHFGKRPLRYPRNWDEETLDMLNSNMSSYFTLLERGDPDARRTRKRIEGRFYAIPGRSGFSIRKGKLVFAPNIFGRDTLAFDIPEEYQLPLLARAKHITKMVISRDEPWLNKPGRYWASVSYEIPKPEEEPFVPEEAVYVALGTASIGIFSSKGEEVVELWSVDGHWIPKIDDIEVSLRAPKTDDNPWPIQKGSKKWRKLKAKRRKMFDLMSRQQTQNRREVVSLRLIEKVVDGIIRGHGVHFVVSDIVIRSKEGKLADGSKAGRGGSQGLNRQAQGKGMAYLAQWLSVKAPEVGGTVRKHRFEPPPGLPHGKDNKLALARALRQSFLASFSA